MHLEWDDGEGFDIRYSAIAEKYGLRGPYETIGHQANQEISQLLQEKKSIEANSEKALATIAQVQKELVEIDASIQELTEKKAIKVKHLAIEDTKVYKDELQSIESDLSRYSERKDAIGKYRKEAEVLASLTFDKDAVITSRIKGLSYVSRDLARTYSDIQPRNEGEAAAITAKDYSEKGRAFCRDFGGKVGFFMAGLVFDEQPIQSCDWTLIAQYGFELAEMLIASPRLRAVNGRLFMRISDDYSCEITLRKLQSGNSEETHSLAICQGRYSEKHPVYSQYEVTYPQNFVLYNAHEIIEHRVFANRLGPSRKLPNLDTGDDD